MATALHPAETTAPTPFFLPICHDTGPPCTTPMTSRPNWWSMTGRHGTSVNSWDCSTTANLPLDSCTVPVSLPLTFSPSRGGAERQPLVLGHLCAGAGQLRVRARWREGCAGRRRDHSVLGWRRPVRCDTRGADPSPRAPACGGRSWQGRPSRHGSAAGPARSRHANRSACLDRPGKGRERWPAGCGPDRRRRRGYRNPRRYAIGRENIRRHQQADQSGVKRHREGYAEDRVRRTNRQLRYYRRARRR